MWQVQPIFTKAMKVTQQENAADFRITAHFGTE